MTKLTLVALKMVPLPEAVHIPFFARFINKETGVFTPEDTQQKAADLMLDELKRWTDALTHLRQPHRS